MDRRKSAHGGHTAYSGSPDYGWGSRGGLVQDLAELARLRAPISLKPGIYSGFHRHTRGLVAPFLRLLKVVFRYSLLGRTSAFEVRRVYSGFKLIGALEPYE
jgi:hypothetical protein